MKTITLGKSGLTVSRIAFGTWQLGGDWGPTDSEAAIAAIRRAAVLLPLVSTRASVATSTRSLSGWSAITVVIP